MFIIWIKLFILYWVKKAISVEYGMSDSYICLKYNSFHKKETASPFLIYILKAADILFSSERLAWLHICTFLARYSYELYICL